MPCVEGNLLLRKRFGRTYVHLKRKVKPLATSTRKSSKKLLRPAGRVYQVIYWTDVSFEHEVVPKKVGSFLVLVPTDKVAIEKAAQTIVTLKGKGQGGFISVSEILLRKVKLPVARKKSAV